jgi:hypothetical protein
VEPIWSINKEGRFNMEKPPPKQLKSKVFDTHGHLASYVNGLTEKRGIETEILTVLYNHNTGLYVLFYY